MTSRDSMLIALAPVAETLVFTARAAAADQLAAAESEASRRLEHARDEAATILARARADGEASAQRAADAAVTSARREGREMILAARRRAYETLRQAVRDELALRADNAEGAALCHRLELLARTRLGPSATIQGLDGDDFGVCATDGNRRIELTADWFVDRELGAAGDRVAELWR